MSTVLDQASGAGWTLYHGDSVEVLQMIPQDSIHLSIFSPPYGSLYVYSASDRDIGNCRDDSEFYAHFDFIIAGLLRVTKPGRIVAVDCQNLPAMKERDGYIGLKDFRGDLIRAFQRAGFIYHAEFTIWKDPLIEATRTKALGLDIIERAIQLYSNPGDVILDPFSGIGSTGYMAIQAGRKFVGSELKRSYFEQAKRNIADAKASQGGLFADAAA